MSRKLDWQRQKADAKANKGGRPAPYVAHAPAGDRLPFPIVYARYANAQRAAGKKPLPPLKWVKRLRSSQRRPAT